jgi:hypothetical protein
VIEIEMSLLFGRAALTKSRFLFYSTNIDFELSKLSKETENISDHFVKDARGIFRCNAVGKLKIDLTRKNQIPIAAAPTQPIFHSADISFNFFTISFSNMAQSLQPKRTDQG